MLPTAPPPYASLPICEMTVGVPLMNGATCILLSIDRQAEEHDAEQASP